MDDVKRLISCLLQTEFSIDTVESLASQLKISRAALLQLIEYERCTNYFQLLRPAKNRPQTPDKIALTLDVGFNPAKSQISKLRLLFQLFCCTHYAQQCRNNDCTFLHMCPYHVRPASTHCTNKSCPNEHDVMKSGHNRSIIDARDLLFLSGATLTEVIRASANPTRSVSAHARSIVPVGSWLVRFSFGFVTNTERRRVVPEDRSVIAYTTVTSLWSTLVRSRTVPMRSMNLVWPIFDRRRSRITTTKIFFKHSEKFFSNGQCDLFLFFICCIDDRSL